MTPPLPITLCLFTSAKGHWGSKDIYKATLAHLDKHCPLAHFRDRLAHIKVGVNDGAIGMEMETHLARLGFHVIKTVADWSRGTSHQHGIIQDERTISVQPRLHSSPFMLLLEDDSPFVTHQISLTDCLARSCQMLADNHELLSVRFLRRGDLDSSPRLKDEKDFFWSEHFNLQPSVIRTRDWYVLHQLIERNWAQVGHLQCELLLRLAFAQLSRSPFQHAVWWPDFGETYHLGVPDYTEQIKALSL